MGYHRAGFKVTGVDIKPQKNYPFDFIQGDALEFAEKNGHKFDVIHTSPPCQHYSGLTPVGYKEKHPALIGKTREVLLALGKPYVIENVPGARRELVLPIKLCGSMFNLPIFRHRYFETNVNIFDLLPPCNHGFAPVVVSGHSRRIIEGRRMGEFKVAVCRSAMAMEWGTRDEVTQAIPPAYTEYLGRQLLSVL